MDTKKTVICSNKNVPPPQVGTVVVFDSLEKDIQELIKLAAVTRTKAYVPHSGFKVGAALQCSNGQVFSGCNVENVAHTPTICAERTAIVKAVSEGQKQFTALAVVADKPDTFTSPCGVCRQTYCEFVVDSPIYLSQSIMDKVLVTSLKQLLPLAFNSLE